MMNSSIIMHDVGNMQHKQGQKSNVVRADEDSTRCSRFQEYAMHHGRYKLLSSILCNTLLHQITHAPLGLKKVFHLSFLLAKKVSGAGIRKLQDDDTTLVI